MVSIHSQTLNQVRKGHKKYHLGGKIIGKIMTIYVQMFIKEESEI